ncbi:hypothetical protein LCGC14_2091870 [marine sediment metagenome]|uniref:Major capsid protein n=1 Tax=marine sediment metagenome TaxID=412755 RepID=A0A0F9H9C6_9ZZZZ
MAATIPASIIGDFKERYNTKGIQDAIPESRVLLKNVEFDKATLVGNAFHTPVILSDEAGFTYAANNAGNYALNGPISLNIPDAQVRPAQITLVSQIAYDALSQSLGSGAAFLSATKLITKRMIDSMSKRVELAALYGGVGLGKTALTGSSQTSGTIQVVAFTQQTWSDGIWAGTVNNEVQFFDAGSLVSSGADSVFTISAVDPSARTLTVTGTATGITALDTLTVGGSVTTLDIFFNSAFGNEMTGIDRILTNTGTLFNISAATFDLWKSNVIDNAAGKLTFLALQNAVATAVGRGLDSEVDVLVNPKVWANLVTSQSGARRFDSSYKKNNVENGATKLTFYSQNGTMNITPSLYVKEGDCFILPFEHIQRIGSMDIEFMPQVMGSDEFFQYVPGFNAYELRLWTNQQIFITLPARCAKVFNISLS